jgi:hypothetical protein
MQPAAFEDFLRALQTPHIYGGTKEPDRGPACSLQSGRTVCRSSGREAEFRNPT